MNSTTTRTQSEQFAEAEAANSAQGVLDLIKFVRRAANLIMYGAMGVSYTHQRAYLASLGAPTAGAWVLPVLLDALTAICVRVLATRCVAASAKRAALVVLILPVVASGGVNFLAPDALIVRALMLVAVLMIPAAEVVASKIRPDFTAMAAAERELAPAPEATPAPRSRKPAPERVFEARMLHPTANMATIARIAKVAPKTAQRVLATVPTSPAHATLAGSPQ